MSVIATTFNATFVVEDPVINRYDKAGAPVIEQYLLLADMPIPGRLTNYTASQSTEKDYAGQPESRVLLKFFCPYRIDLKRGQRVTKIGDDGNPILGPGNQAWIINITNPGGENDHLQCTCEERQKGFKVF